MYRFSTWLMLVWPAISLTNNDNTDIQVPQSRTCLSTVFRLEDGHVKYLGMINNGPEQPDSGWNTNLFLLFWFLSIFSDPKISWRGIKCPFKKCFNAQKCIILATNIQQIHRNLHQRPRHAKTTFCLVAVCSQKGWYTRYYTPKQTYRRNTASQGSVVLELVISTETETALFVCPLPAA